MGALHQILSGSPQSPTWLDVSLRLALTLIAGGILGFNRQERGHAAGLRTTILVGLAAAIAMVLAGILIPTAGKAPDGYVKMDVMRLPLGILTGVGFIGGGAILRKGEMVRGVTTAATLWIITVIGLCFGAGQLGLGIGGTALGFFTLCGLKWFDMRIPRQHHGALVIVADPGFSLDGLARMLAPAGYQVSFRKDTHVRDARQLTFEVTWSKRDIECHTLDLVSRLEGRYSVVSFEVTSELF